MGADLERAVIDNRLPELTLETEEAWGVIADLLDCDEARAIGMVFRKGMTQQECAEVEGVSQQTISRRVETGIAKLRKQPILIRTLQFIVDDLNRHGKPEFVKPIQAVASLKKELGHLKTVGDFKGYFGGWDSNSGRMPVAEIVKDNKRRLEKAKERGDEELYFAALLIEQLIDELSSSRSAFSELQESIDEDEYHSLDDESEYDEVKDYCPYCDSTPCYEELGGHCRGDDEEAARREDDEDDDCDDDEDDDEEDDET